jgi:hypothetical protein
MSGPIVTHGEDRDPVLPTDHRLLVAPAANLEKVVEALKAR